MHLPWGAQKGSIVRISEIPVELVCWSGSSQTPLNIIEVVCPPIFLVEQIVCFDKQRGVEAVPQAVERLLGIQINPGAKWLISFLHATFWKRVFESTTGLHAINHVGLNIPEQTRFANHWAPIARRSVEKCHAPKCRSIPASYAANIQL